MKSTFALILQRVTTCIDNLNVLNSNIPLISDSNSCPNLIWGDKYLEKKKKTMANQIKYDEPRYWKE